MDSLLSGIQREIINPLILLLLGAGLIVFLYGVVQVLFNADSEEARSQGRQHMIWGVFGLAIMIGVFGVFNMIVKTIEVIAK